MASNLVEKLPGTNVCPTSYVKGSYPDSIIFYPSTPNETKTIIIGMKSKFSTGIDGIPAFLLKHLPLNILYTLSFIFNLTLASGTFITSFETAKVTPIFKKGNRKPTENYRPITLLPVFSKISEKIVRSRLYSYCSRMNIFSNCQFGFRKSYSTSQACTSLTSK